MEPRVGWRHSMRRRVVLHAVRDVRRHLQAQRPAQRPAAVQHRVEVGVAELRHQQPVVLVRRVWRAADRNPQELHNARVAAGAHAAGKTQLAGPVTHRTNWPFRLRWSSPPPKTFSGGGGAWHTHRKDICARISSTRCAESPMRPSCSKPLPPSACRMAWMMATGNGVSITSRARKTQLW
jgi:hypothetical protein